MQIELSVPVIILIIAAVTIQAILIFRDAVKSSIPYPYLWGFIGLLNIPSSTIYYLIFKKVYLKKKAKKER